MSGSGVMASTNAVTFGSRQSAAGGAYTLQTTAYLEEFAIYNYALSAGQVSARMVQVRLVVVVLKRETTWLAAA